MDQPTALEYFSGGVPTGEYFRMTLDDIEKVSSSDQAQQDGINRLQELCFIGVLSYFEAFCKDQFAAIVNIEPSLVTRLKASRQDVMVDAEHVGLYGGEASRRLGFLLANKYDFGTPQKINALFGALLTVSPFSKKESRQFERLLLDRNLLVHHGGTFTLQYLEQATLEKDDRPIDAFMNSRIVTREEVTESLHFIAMIARKVLRASHDGLLRYISDRGLEYSTEQKKAVHFLVWWGDDEA